MGVQISVIASDWSGENTQPPERVDFDPFNKGFDAETAWRHFGGLSRKEAYIKFCKSPDYYQEDFMFMGGRAFVFYYPVIERFLLESRVSDDEDQEEVESCRILAHCIAAQFKSGTSEYVEELRHRVLRLVKFVRSHLDRFSNDAACQQTINQAWRELETTLTRDHLDSGGD
jgi:hypothetical protein